MTENIRPDAVAQIVEILSDDSLSTDTRVELVMNSSATAAEKYAAAQRFSTLTTSALVESGMARPSSPPSILDATLGQLQLLAAVYGVIAKWDVVITHRDMTLGNVLKVLTPDETECVVDLLRRGGMLP